MDDPVGCRRLKLNFSKTLYNFKQISLFQLSSYNFHPTSYLIQMRSNYGKPSGGKRFNAGATYHGGHKGGYGYDRDSHDGGKPSYGADRFREREDDGF
jgi:hypothetical protein